MKALKYNQIQDLKKDIDRPTRKISLILDQISSLENLAHIFRLSDALCIESIYLYKMNKSLINQKTKKLSRSTTKNTPIQYVEEIEVLRNMIAPKEIIALEWTDQSQSIYKLENISENIALLVGSESNGLSDDLLAHASKSIHLPMYGVNSSINAAMAASISCYHLMHI